MVKAVHTRISARSVVTSLLLGMMVGCASEDMSDLDAFMEEKRARPGGVIEPIPCI
jgi:Tfp pilus assembly protein PilP